MLFRDSLRCWGVGVLQTDAQRLDLAPAAVTELGCGNKRGPTAPAFGGCGADNDAITGSEVEDVTGSEVEDVTGSEVVDVTGSEVEDVTGSEAEDVTGSEATDVTGREGEDFTGSEAEDVSGSEAEDVNKIGAEDVIGSEADAVGGCEAGGVSRFETDDITGSETDDIGIFDVDIVNGSDVILIPADADDVGGNNVAVVREWNPFDAFWRPFLIDGEAARAEKKAVGSVEVVGGR